MIRYYHKTAKDHGTKEHKKFTPGSWVYVEKASKSETQELVKEFDLDSGHLDDAQDSDEMPRLEREGDQTYFFTRFARTDTDLVLTTTPLLIIFHPKCLITVSLEAIPGLDKLTNGKIEVTTSHQGQLALQILDQVDDKYERNLSEIGKQIKSIRARLRVEEIRNKDFISFVTIEDELNEFMTALTPMTPILKLFIRTVIGILERNTTIRFQIATW